MHRLHAIQFTADEWPRCDNRARRGRPHQRDRRVGERRVESSRHAAAAARILLFGRSATATNCILATCSSYFRFISGYGPTHKDETSNVQVQSARLVGSTLQVRFTRAADTHDTQADRSLVGKFFVFLLCQKFAMLKAAFFFVDSRVRNATWKLVLQAAHSGRLVRRRLRWPKMQPILQLLRPQTSCTVHTLVRRRAEKLGFDLQFEVFNSKCAFSPASILFICRQTLGDADRKARLHQRVRDDAASAQEEVVETLELEAKIDDCHSLAETHKIRSRCRRQSESNFRPRCIVCNAI